ncbi:uncharacterized mitochondrial protein AtMg00860-like [Malus sylvestris]|uniref:uncharacterized mitochondrial protein AtMg00860-like n=1 Tax=Malus sylvestris TaxID=3752 RepID=UPI0021AC124B|nr:uncharacterized mitochondrial protein AtMg00860-like [Malus sylvestris]
MNHLFLKKQNCVFSQSCVEYLGHIVSKEGVAAYPSKLRAISELPIPKNVKQLRGFLGLTGYYRKFVPGYRRICQPLYNLTKKDRFKWDVAAEEAFKNLKGIMASSQVLTLPDFSIPFEIECDALEVGIGAALQQIGRPIAFTS